MSGSSEHDLVALVSITNEAHIEGIFNLNILEIDFQERQTMLEEAQEVLRTVAQYMEPTSTIQMVCAHPAQRNLLLKQITDLKSR
jgi:adenine deaminase